MIFTHANQSYHYNHYVVELCCDMQEAIRQSVQLGPRFLTPQVGQLHVYAVTCHNEV